MQDKTGPSRNAGEIGKNNRKTMHPGDLRIVKPIV
jgi:hypothetical protein